MGVGDERRTWRFWFHEAHRPRNLLVYAGAILLAFALLLAADVEIRVLWVVTVAYPVILPTVLPAAFRHSAAFDYERYASSRGAWSRRLDLSLVVAAGWIGVAFALACSNALGVIPRSAAVLHPLSLTRSVSVWLGMLALILFTVTTTVVLVTLVFFLRTRSYFRQDYRVLEDGL